MTEAINSMYDWYAAATECYAYLSDVTILAVNQDFDPHFWSSRWFTRGWTLQELLAPRAVIFFSSDWNEIGTKATLDQPIAEITGISLHYLYRDLRDASVAQKMSWASMRQTTRLEDVAYSLLGLFNVNMPLLYGEGSNAFIRLQMEIIRQSDDESIFAWSRRAPLHEVAPSSAMFANSPADFKDSRDIIRAYQFPWSQRTPYNYTNKGLFFEIRRLESDVDDSLTSQRINSSGEVMDPQYIVPLNCRREGLLNTAIVLHLQHLELFRDENRVIRTYFHKLDSLELKAPKQQKVLSRMLYVAGVREFDLLKSSGAMNYMVKTIQAESEPKDRRVLYSTFAGST